MIINKKNFIFIFINAFFSALHLFIWIQIFVWYYISLHMELPLNFFLCVCGTDMVVRTSLNFYLSEKDYFPFIF